MTAVIVDFQSFSILILICVSSLLCYSLLFRKQKESRVGLNLPPSPPSLPIIGHLHLFINVLLHKSLQKVSSKYGPLLLLRIFNFPIVLASSASITNEIFRMHDINVSSRGGAVTDELLLFGSSGFISAPHGDYWKFMKKLVATKLLGAQAIQQSRGTRSKELHRFLLNLLDKARKNESVEIGTEAKKLTNNIICRMSVGRSCSEENGETERIRELVTVSFGLAKKMFVANMLRKPLEKIGISLFKKEIMGVSQEFDQLLERMLVEHEETIEGHQDRDMMDFLLEAYRNEKAEYKITRNQIKSFLLDIFLAGIDTASRTIQWTIAEIINNPKILEKLRQELDCVVGKTRLIEEADLPNLPYLQAVVKEGLRLHSPSSLLVRRFEESCEIKDFYIPGKTILIVNTFAIMRDPKFWEDPDVFKPERFLASSASGKEDKIREQVMNYIPFGGGRRACPGEKLAYIFVETAIGAMVQCFDWRIKGEKLSMEEAIGELHLTMAHPLNCTPVVRLHPFNF